MYLLKPKATEVTEIGIINLHSTMYLLKPLGSRALGTAALFTFHHVSIKTKSLITFLSLKFYLHSTMYLLKHE